MSSGVVDVDAGEAEDLEPNSQPRLYDIEAEIERLKPLALADRYAKIAQIENHWRGSEEQLQAAIDELEREKQREADELERREALEFAGKATRLDAKVAQYLGDCKMRADIKAKMSQSAEYIRSAAQKPEAADDVNFSHANPEIHERLQRDLVEVKAYRELQHQLNWTRPDRREIDRLIEEEPALELMLPPELRANDVPA